jgi:carboxyl-terminal processing protease
LIILNALPGAPLAEFWESTLYDRFRESLLSLSRAKARSLVLDLRRCVGLNHSLAARLSGMFHRQRLFYAVAGRKDPASRDPAKLKADPRSLVQVIPQDLYWRAPVAVLLGAQTMGAAEGLAHSIQNAPNGTVVGTTTSGGRPGQLTADPLVEVWMPEGYCVTFQREAVLNQDGVVHLESNRFGEGGVRPNIRVPRSIRTFEERWLGNLDVELTFGIQALSHMVDRLTRGVF